MFTHRDFAVFQEAFVQRVVESVNRKMDTAPAVTFNLNTTSTASSTVAAGGTSAYAAPISANSGSSSSAIGFGDAQGPQRETVNSASQGRYSTSLYTIQEHLGAASSRSISARDTESKAISTSTQVCTNFKHAHPKRVLLLYMDRMRASSRLNSTVCVALSQRPKLMRPAPTGPRRSAFFHTLHCKLTGGRAFVENLATSQLSVREKNCSN